MSPQGGQLKYGSLLAHNLSYSKADVECAAGMLVATTQLPPFSFQGPRLENCMTTVYILSSSRLNLVHPEEFSALCSLFWFSMLLQFREHLKGGAVSAKH